MASSEDDERDVTQIVEQYRRGFATPDGNDLRTLWDHEYDDLVYIATEKAHPIRDWPGIEQYYDNIVKSTASASMETDEISVHVIGDMAYAFGAFHYEGRTKGETDLFVANVRVTFVLRRSDGWKVVHFHESIPGSL